MDFLAQAHLWPARHATLTPSRVAKVVGALYAQVGPGGTLRAQFQWNRNGV